MFTNTIHNLGIYNRDEIENGEEGLLLEKGIILNRYQI